MGNKFNIQVGDQVFGWTVTSKWNDYGVFVHADGKSTCTKNASDNTNSALIGFNMIPESAITRKPLIIETGSKVMVRDVWYTVIGIYGDRMWCKGFESNWTRVFFRSEITKPY